VGAWFATVQVIGATAANLALIGATINTTAKYAGKPVWVTDAQRMVWAATSAAGGVWKDGVNATVYTPV
jgi:fructose-specific component phosphotransferase system IIB-like protein